MRKKVTKIISAFCCTAMMLALFAGCGSTQSQSGSETKGASDTTAAAGTQESTTTPAEKVTLKLGIANTTDLSGTKAATKYIEEKFNIDTEYDLLPSGTELDNLVKTRLASGEMDDLFAYNSGSLLQAVNPEQNFIDLSNESFMTNVLDSFKSVVSVNSKVYGIPSGSSFAGGWFYNKRVYKELNLKVPKTWSELMANCEKIKAAGKVAVIGSFKDTWSSQLVFLADYYNVQAAVPTFAADYTAHKAGYANTPAALRGFEKLEEIYKKGYMNKDTNATTVSVGEDMIANGDGVQYPMLTMVLPDIAKKYPDKIDDIGIFPQPGDSADKNGFTVWMPGGIYLYKNSKNIDAAKKWMEGFVSPEAMAAFAKAQKPTGPFVVKGVTLPDDSFGAVKDMLPYFDSGNTSPALEFLSPIKGPNLEMITVEAGSGIKSALECAKEYDKDVVKQAKQLGLAGW